MSRFRVFAVFAALLVGGSALAACGGSSNTSNGQDPQKVVNEATLKGVNSGSLALSVAAKVGGEGGGNLNLSLSGPFQSQGKGQLPQLAMNAKASGSVNGRNVDFSGGLTLLPEKAFVNYKGTTYEVDPTTFGFVKSAIERAQQRSGAQSKSGAIACQESVSNLKVASFVKNLTNDGNSEAGGTSTTHVSGDLNVSGAIDALLEITKSPACASQLGAAGPVPSVTALEKAKGQLESALKKAHVDLYVGADHIVRRVSVALLIEPPSGSGGGPKKVELNFDLTLSGVNQHQTIAAPSGAKPISMLFQQLGVNPIELLNSVGGKGLRAGGLGNLLKGLAGRSGALGGLSSSLGGASSLRGGASSAGGGSGAQQAYQKCLAGVRSPADLQKCAALLK